MLVSSIARVIGPTPLGFGETQPATSHTSGATSPAILPSTRGDADVEHRGAGLDHVGGDDAGHAGGRHDDVGVAHVGGEVAGAGVAQRDGGVLRAAGQQQAERAADGETAADDARPRRRRSRRRGGAAARSTPTGVQGSGPASPSTSLPRLVGCSPSTSLSGSTRDSSANSSSPVGCWTRKPVQAGSALSSSMTASTSAWVAVGGQVAADRGDADLGAVLVLGADVPAAAGVVADQHRAEAGDDAPLPQGGDALGELGLDGPQRGCAVQGLCRHGGQSDRAVLDADRGADPETQVDVTVTRMSRRSERTPIDASTSTALDRIVLLRASADRRRHDARGLDALEPPKSCVGPVWLVAPARRRAPAQLAEALDVSPQQRTGLGARRRPASCPTGRTPPTDRATLRHA